MAVVAGDTGRPHDDRDDVADPVGQERPGDVDKLLLRVLPQAGKGAALEIVQLMGRPVLERKVRDEAVGDVVLLLADHMPELDGEGRGNRDRTGNVGIVVDDLGVAGRCEHAPHHVARVIGAEAADQRIEVGRLAAQQGLGEVAQIEPGGDGQAGEQQEHQRDEDRLAMPRGIYGRSGHDCHPRIRRAAATAEAGPAGR